MISYLKSSFVKPDDNICCPDPKHWAILVNKEFFFSPKGYYLILFFAWYLMCIANCGRIIQLTNCGVFWNLKGVLRRSDGFLGKWKHHSPSVFGAFWNLKLISNLFLTIASTKRGLCSWLELCAGDNSIYYLIILFLYFNTENVL